MSSHTLDMVEELLQLEADLEFAESQEEADALDKRLMEIHTSLLDRVDYFGEVIFEYEKQLGSDDGRLEAIKRELDLVNGRKKRIQKSLDRLVLHIIPAAVDAVGGILKTETGTWKIRESKSVNVTDPTAIPADLTRTKVEPNLVAIKARIESGQAIAGAEIVVKRKAYRR